MTAGRAWRVGPRRAPGGARVACAMPAAEQPQATRACPRCAHTAGRQAACWARPREGKQSAHHVPLWPLVHKAQLDEDAQQPAVLALLGQLVHLRHARAQCVRAGGCAAPRACWCMGRATFKRPAAAPHAHAPPPPHQHVLPRRLRLVLRQRALRQRARQLTRAAQGPALACGSAGGACMPLPSLLTHTGLGPEAALTQRGRARARPSSQPAPARRTHGRLQMRERVHPPAHLPP